MSVQSETIAEKTVILSLELGRISNNRKVSTSLVDTDVDRKMLHVSVDLFDSKEMKKVNTFLNRVARDVKSMTVPSFFRGGMFLVKNEAVEKLDEYLLQAEAELAPLVSAFSEVSEHQKEEAKERLGSAFDKGLERSYPTPDRIKEVFRIEWRWLILGTPDALKEINANIWRRETSKAQTALDGAVQSIESMLATEAKGLADHMIERLTPDQDGNKKIFRNSMVGNLREFLQNYSLRAIGSSKELDQEISRMKDLLAGVNVHALRNNDSLREDISKGFTKVAERLDTLVQKPRRFMDLKGIRDGL